MSIFQLKRKPRRFHHIPIYYDEHAKPEAEPFDELRGAFVQGTTHLQRRKRQQGRWTGNVRILLLLIFIFVMVWFFLNN